MKNLNKNLLRNSILLLTFLVVILAIGISINSEISVETNFNSDEISPKAAKSDESYASYQGFTPEYKVDKVISKGGDNAGNGHFHIEGLVLWVIDTSTTRAHIRFGFDTDAYQSYGPPITYEVRATVRYRNWNDQGGDVKLYIRKDNGDWQRIWQQTGLGGVDRTWEVFWASGSSEYYRSDGSMQFKVVGSSWTNQLWEQPSVKVNVNDLRVKFNYDPHTYYQGYVWEYKVYEVESVGGDSKGTGNFHIRGASCALFDTSTTRARLEFALPGYGQPVSYKVRATVRYRNWNDVGGYVKLYIQKDNGDWRLIWQKTGLDGVDKTWNVFWESGSPDYYRDNGYMRFKIVGSSWTDVWLQKPSCKVNLYNLRVELNFPPEVNAGPDISNVYEGDTIAFHGSFHDNSWYDSHTIEWFFGDGGTASGTLHPTHAYGDNGDYLVTLKVTDSEGNVGTDTLLVQVLNVAPSGSAGPDQVVNEGELVIFSGSFTDPGWLDTHTITWYFYAGGPSTTGTLTPTFTYEEDGGYNVYLTVRDDDIASFTDILYVDVLNVAPILTGLVATTINEGGTTLLTGNIYDPGSLDYFALTVDWGDGSPIEYINYPAGTTTFGLTHPYVDDGIYTISLSIEDDDLGSSSESLTVTVNNVAPTLNGLSAGSVGEGSLSILSGIITDPGIEDVFRMSIDWGDGTPVELYDFPAGTSSFSLPHFYVDNGVYTITILLSDYASFIIKTTTANIYNEDPHIRGLHTNSINEGDFCTLTGSIEDPGLLDSFVVTVDWGDGSSDIYSYSTFLIPFSETHQYLDNAIYTIIVTIEDDDGGSTTDSTTIMVYNVAPTVDAGPDQIIIQGETAFFTGYSVIDPGLYDTHTFLWDFGDGSPPSASNSHTYIAYGTYVVTLTVTDNDGGVGSDTLTIVVMDVIDPTTSITYDIYKPPDHVSTSTLFTLTAIDNPFGSGIDIIQYQIDSSGWITYNGPSGTGPFKIDTKGEHTIYYRSIDNAGNEEDPKELTVIVNAVELTYIGDLSGIYSDTVLLKAKLLDIATQQEIGGKTIIFTIGDQNISAVTDSDGIASAILILNQTSGSYIISALFTGDDTYLSDSDSTEFIIEKETVIVEYTGDTVIPISVDMITLRAILFDDDDGYLGDLTTITVKFSIYDENYGFLISYFVSVEETSIVGVGIAVKEVTRPTQEGVYLIQVTIDHDYNDYYCGAPSDLVTLIVYEPTGDFVTGGGWIWDTDGNKGNFGFNVKYKKNGLPKGQAIYVYREGEFVFIVKSNAWIGMAIDPENSYSIFQAKCNVKKIDPITGEILWEEGNYQLLIEVWDNSENGEDDVIQIRVFDKIGLIFHEAGYDPFGYLQGGNIVIHIDKKKK